jgi:hypothetical protein
MLIMEVELISWPYFFSVFVHENRYFFDPRFKKLQVLTKKMKNIFSVFVHELKYCLNLPRINR